jgi:dsRNA-specific ribonuclease
MFQVEVWVGGECLADGLGSTKKEAEQRAASRALSGLERMEQTKAGG